MTIVDCGIFHNSLLEETTNSDSVQLTDTDLIRAALGHCRLSYLGRGSLVIYMAVRLQADKRSYEIEIFLF